MMTIMRMMTKDSCVFCLYTKLKILTPRKILIKKVTTTGIIRLKIANRQDSKNRSSVRFIIITMRNITVLQQIIKNREILNRQTHPFFLSYQLIRIIPIITMMILRISSYITSIVSYLFFLHHLKIIISNHLLFLIEGSVFFMVYTIKTNTRQIITIIAGKLNNM